MLKKSNLENKQVIVTGATGFIGRHLICALQEKKCRIAALCRDKSKAEKLYGLNNIHIIEYDIQKSDAPLPSECLFKDSILVHLAWQNLPHYTKLFHFEENLPQQYQFIKKAVQQGVSQVLVTGTCFEYGLQYGPLPPSIPTKPVTSYALAKDYLHQFLLFLQKTNPFILQWARLFYVYGEGQNSSSLLPLLQAAIDRQDPVFNMSKGEQIRDFIEVSEVVNQLIEQLEIPRNITFNVCSENPISVRRFVEAYLEKKDTSISLNLGYYPYAEYEPLAFWGIRF